MQDRFKFRGLNKGQWYYGGYFKHLPYTPQCCSGKTPEKDYKHLIIQDGFSDWGLPRDMKCTEVDSKTVGQCTGLKDKNGKLIYEGDILEGYKTIESSINSKYILKRGLVKIPDGAFVATCQDMKEHCTLFVQFDWDKTEIIGNVYENPELLG